MGKKKSSRPKLSECELRRFALKTDNPDEIKELDRVIEKHDLSRRDLGVILLFLCVQPGFEPEDFGIYTRSTPKRLSDCQ